jgi:5'-3' exonuclease
MEVIKEYAPQALVQRDLSYFRGQTWAIDASIFLYKFMYNSKTKKPDNHINGFYCLFNLLYKHGIRCILVFDGQAPPLKRACIEDRKKVRRDLQDRISTLVEAGQTEEASRLQKRIIQFPETTYEDIYQICQLMDVPYYRAKYEADYLCSKLYSEGKVQAVVSNDTDMAMYQVGHIIRNLDYYDHVDHIDLSILLSSLHISYSQFVQLCILLGTDFNDSIAGYGKANSVHYICSGKTLEQISHLITYNYHEIYDYIMNCRDHDQTSNILLLSINACLPVMSWEPIKTILTTRCNYRPSTIDRHQLQFKFPITNDPEMQDHIDSLPKSNILSIKTKIITPAQFKFKLKLNSN